MPEVEDVEVEEVERVETVERSANYNSLFKPSSAATL